VAQRVPGYPRELLAKEITPRLATLVHTLANRMLAGPSPEHAALREQLATARLSRISLTGAGLYAYFEHGPDAPMVFMPDVIGGEVPLQVRTLDAPAGSLLKVSGGRLEFVEIYTFGDIAWPDDPDVTEFGEATPLPIPVRAT
jgi:hypothetical protein